MAISKTQPMRSAENALIDAVNSQDGTLLAHQQAINTLSEGIADEVSNRERADNALSGQINAEARIRADADDGIQAIIGNGFTQQNTIANSLSATNEQVLLLGQEVEANTDAIEDLQAFNSNLKIGKIADIVIPANDSISTSYSFSEPFPAYAACILVAQVITDELATLFTCTLIDCTYSGFSYSIANSDADPHTVALGFIAVNVNTI